VQGETWTARSSQPLDRDDEVVVLAREGLVLVVEGVKHKREELAQGENLS
jgi:membrane-bound ClpP family serine protease